MFLFFGGFGLLLQAAPSTEQCAAFPLVRGALTGHVASLAGVARVDRNSL